MNERKPMREIYRTKSGGLNSLIVIPGLSEAEKWKFPKPWYVYDHRYTAIQATTKALHNGSTAIVYPSEFGEHIEDFDHYLKRVCKHLGKRTMDLAIMVDETIYTIHPETIFGYDEGVIETVPSNPYL